MSNLCAVCQIVATQTCSACGRTFYCSKQHQKEDWKRHKTSCTPFKTETDEVLGRHVVATRNINPGEVIMKSPPLILGPKTVSPPLCLGCHRRLNLEKVRYDCSKCHWPLCGQKCETSPQHGVECEVFAKARYRPTVKNDNSKQSVYSAVAPLRALLLKKKEGEFDLLLNCQSHLDKHLTTPIYQILRHNLVPFFTDVLKIDTNESEILRICSIFDTNCFEVRDSQGLVNVRGLYPTVALLSHDCKHNTKHSFHGDDFKLVLTATVPIKKGDLITATYTQTLWGTLARRSHLKVSKHFDCGCNRCSDPTEFGTYVGSVNCIKCCNGKVLSCDPLERDSDWKCDKCGFVVSGDEMVWRDDALRREIAGLDKTNPKNLEEFLVKHQAVLHSTNSFVLQVKYALCQMYGNVEGFRLKEMGIGLMDRKIQLCRELLQVADVLEAGHSRFRGSLLYDLYEVMVARAKRRKEKVPELVKGYLKEANQILCTEPDFKEIVQRKMNNL